MSTREVSMHSKHYDVDECIPMSAPRCRYDSRCRQEVPDKPPVRKPVSKAATLRLASMLGVSVRSDRTGIYAQLGYNEVKYKTYGKLYTELRSIKNKSRRMGV